MLRCSFCIIPYVRPQLDEPAGRAHPRRSPPAGRPRLSRSRAHRHSPGALRRRLESARAEGRSGLRLSHLVRQIAELPGDFRVRLSSIEATEVTRELIDVMADHPDKVAPHLHISMQSGSDARAAPHAAPLGQPAVHRPLPAACRSGSTGRRSRPTSSSASPARRTPSLPRRSTPPAPSASRRSTSSRSARAAARRPPTMPNQVPKHVQQERSRELAAVEAELRDAYYRSLLGRQLRVLGGNERASTSGRSGSAHRAAMRRSNLLPAAADEGRFVDVDRRRSPRRSHSSRADASQIRPVVRPFFDRYNRPFDFSVKFGYQVGGEKSGNSRRHQRVRSHRSADVSQSCTPARTSSRSWRSTT